MKKILIGLFIVSILGSSNSLLGYRFSSATFMISTDIIELFDEDYQIEFVNFGRSRSAFAVRVGSYRTIEASENVYPGDERRWEIGARWRYFLTNQAPNLIFFGTGFDNRPEDSTVTPIGELGINVLFKPLAVSLIGFYGYEVHWRHSEANRWLGGVEIRAGFCF